MVSEFAMIVVSSPVCGIFPESATRPIQSLGQNVRLCLCMCLCLRHCAIVLKEEGHNLVTISSFLFIFLYLLF